MVGNPADGFPYCGIDNFQAMYEPTKVACQKHDELIYYSPSLASCRDDNNRAQEFRYEGFLKSTKETTDDVIIPYEFRFKPFWTKN